MNNFSIESILHLLIVTLPFSASYFLSALLLCGYKDRLNLKALSIVVIIETFLDILFTFLLNRYGMQPIPFLITTTLLIIIFFNIDFLSALISSAIASLFNLFTQFIFINVIALIIGTNFKELIHNMNENSYVDLVVSGLFFILVFTILFYIYKKNLTIINLQKFKVFNNKSSKLFSNVTLIAIIITPMTFFILINYSIDYYNIFNNVNYSFPIYLAINSLVIIISSVLMFYLANKVIGLKYYQESWETHQKYLNDINELLKGLKSQKHGFINHMNILNGLITLGDIEEAKEYLNSINQVISLNNSVASSDNPTLNALLNVRSKKAETKNVGFDVEINESLSGIVFNVFELEEAIGNIIDNAIEATSEFSETERYVRVNIYSDNKSYIFDIQNRGNTISPETISKIFDEGFTTKKYESGDHGFGLYISKKIIECHLGTIEVQSQNNYTSFKISLPKVVKNGFKAS